MKRLKALADSPDLLELQKDFPRGACFRHVVGAMVRQIILVLQDRLYDLGSSIRISITPASDRNAKDGTPRLPTAVIVRDGEVRRTIGIATQETSLLIAGKLLMTARDDAVTRVGGALVAAIEAALEPNETSEA